MKVAIVVLAVVLLVGGIAVVQKRQARLNPAPENGGAGVIKGESTPGEVASTRQFTIGSGEYTYTLTVDGKDRQYMAFVPASYDKKTKTPLVMFYHGGGGSMDQAARDYDMKAKASKEGFIVVFGNGASRFPRGKLATWNAGDCCGYARDTKSDDVGYTREVIADMESKFFIDTEKIFATGMSNGGMMAHRLACEMSDVFKAVASVTGTDGTLSCDPKQPISVMHIHAKDDDHVLIGGGAGSESFGDMGEKVADFTSVADTIARWVTRNHMDGTPKRVLEVPGAYCDLYTSSQNQSQVKLCITDTGGHSWPGGPAVRGKTPSQVLSANDVIWDFFKSQK
ncbi:MAG: prolyl oligopeptidase family serine peptidase [Candidatus Moranbacteria bacterium]|nr:prolyl oligopeptidase family serine peptidase [Candidatus Moranbacteria bacterium]